MSTPIEFVRILQRVAELPDRTSPDDWPDAMLVTHAELNLILHEEFGPRYAAHEGLRQALRELVNDARMVEREIPSRPLSDRYRPLVEAGEHALAAADKLEPRPAKEPRSCPTCGKPGHHDYDHAGWEPR